MTDFRVKACKFSFGIFCSSTDVRTEYGISASNGRHHGRTIDRAPRTLLRAHTPRGLGSRYPQLLLVVDGWPPLVLSHNDAPMDY